MKKMLAMLLVMICFVSTSFAEGVIVLSSPDANNAPVSGSLDDMKLGEEIDMGDRIYKPIKYETRNEVFGHNSGDEAEYLVLWLDVFNFSQKKQKYFTDATIIVTYESERGAYQFGGFVWNMGASGHDNYGTEKTENFYDIEPLYNGYYLFGCTVPNFVVETSGELKMEITTGDTTLTYYIRR